MRTLKVEVSDTIYEHIIFFLKSLPQNLINISDEKEYQQYHEKSVKNQVKELFSTHNIKAFRNYSALKLKKVIISKYAKIALKV